MVRIDGRLKRAAGLVLVTTMLLPASATAQRDDCMQRLWAAPLEASALPGGWTLTSFNPSPIIGVSLTFSGPKVGEWEYSGEERLASADVSLFCSPAPVSFLEAYGRGNEISGRREIAVAPIGDATLAIRNTSGNLAIIWASGDVAGLLSASQPSDVDPVPWQDLEDIALAVNAQLP